MIAFRSTRFKVLKATNEKIVAEVLSDGGAAAAAAASQARAAEVATMNEGGASTLGTG